MSLKSGRTINKAKPNNTIDLEQVLKPVEPESEIKKTGAPIKPDYLKRKQQLKTYVTARTFDDFKVSAERNNITVSALLNLLIKQHLENE